jgi:hypothetical protein
MKVTELYQEGVRHVVHNMRAKDKEEIYATQWNDDPTSFSNQVLLSGDFGFVLHADDGEPVVCCGAVPVWAGVWSVWMFATDRFDEIAMSVHKFGRRVFFPSLDAAGWHRLECRSLATHEIAHRWLEVLGAYKESETANYGKNGEAFMVYCWTKPPAKTQSI